MAEFDLVLSPADYRAGIETLRRGIADRSPTISAVAVRNPYGRSVTLFLRHSNLYVVGLDFGGGPYRFSNEADLPDARPLEFSSSYLGMGLVADARRITAGDLWAAVTGLSNHAAARNGSSLVGGTRRSIALLIFAIAEAMRFQTIEDAVAGLLDGSSPGILFRTFSGASDEINNWGTYSLAADWANYGIRVRHL